jgi:periplasmic protein TonB
MAYIDAAGLADQREFFRWGGCAAVVLAAHGLFALAIASRTPDADVDAGAPVVLVELAPLAVAPPAPRSELAPGPMQPDNESQERVSQEAKPEQKEPEVKPETDEVMAPNPTVVLPPPVPRPAEKPEEVAQVEPKEAAPVPTAPPEVTAPGEQPATPTVGAVAQPSAAATATWQRLLQAHLERHKRFPPQAQNERGVSTLVFTIDRQGRVLNARISRSSGSALLDGETLAMIRRAQPLPVPPASIADAQLSFSVPIRYGGAR